MRARPIPSGPSSVPLAVLAVVLAVHGVLKSLFFFPPYIHLVAIPVEVATGGLITTVTLAGLISWVVLGATVGGLGRLRPSDVGLSGPALREAVPVLIGLWLVSQGVQAVVERSGGAPGAGPFEITAGAAIGMRLQAVVGSGLLEETLYRGFLLVQVYAWCRGRFGRERSIVWAVALSSAYFGANHIPSGLRAGLTLAEAGGFALYSGLVGAMFAALYLRTGNLFVAAGAHALINDPIPVFTQSAEPSVTVLAIVCVLMLAWPLLARRFRFTVGYLEGSPAL